MSGSTRDALVAFLDASQDLPVEHRVAVFDDDGTLWAERPVFMQLAFFVAGLLDELRARRFSPFIVTPVGGGDHRVVERPHIVIEVSL